MTDAPAAPPAAVDVFGPELDRVGRYAELLCGSGVQRGLLGPREAVRLWERHLLNCGVVAELLPEGCSVLDIGSGAGLPGIPMVLARPDVQMVLVEPLLRRTTWLQEVVEVLDLGDRVTVVRSRAQDLPGGSADVVTSRAVAALDVLLPMSSRCVRPGGVVLAIKGRQADDELGQVRGRLGAWSLTDAHVTSCGGAVLEEPTTVVVAGRTLS